MLNSGCFTAHLPSLLLIYLSVYPLFQSSVFSIVLLAFAACTVSTSSFTNSNSLIYELFLLHHDKIHLYIDWRLDLASVFCKMDGGSCTHCICSMAALGESTGKFDVDKHVSYKGHSGSLTLSYSSGSLQPCHQCWQEQSTSRFRLLWTVIQV